MKYIDADKLTRLLDAKYKEFMGKAKTEGYTTLQYQYMADGIDIAEQLIDSLQQEQPEADLEKEIGACWQNWLSPSNQKEVEGILPKTEFAMYARHFYVLGRQEQPEVFDTMTFQKGVQEGRRLEREDALTIADIEKFRREAAKDFTVALVSSGSGLNPKTIAYAIEMADELIKQLKEK